MQRNARHEPIVQITECVEVLVIGSTAEGLADRRHFRPNIG